MMILGLKTTQNKDFTLIINRSISPNLVVESKTKPKQTTNNKKNPLKTSRRQLGNGGVVKLRSESVQKPGIQTGTVLFLTFPVAFHPFTCSYSRKKTVLVTAKLLLTPSPLVGSPNSKPAFLHVCHSSARQDEDKIILFFKESNCSPVPMEIPRAQPPAEIIPWSTHL